jgi:hypothetical protein
MMSIGAFFFPYPGPKEKRASLTQNGHALYETVTIGNTSWAEECRHGTPCLLGSTINLDRFQD